MNYLKYNNMSKFNSFNKAKSDEDLKELIDEHKQLVKVLKSPSKEDDKKETEKQEGELKEYEERLKDFKKAWEDMLSGIKEPEIEKAVLTHQLQRDYEHIAETVKNYPPRETLGILSLPNTAKVIDIDKIWSDLMTPFNKGGEGSSKKKTINLTTKQKSEKHFNNLEEEKRKQDVKSYSKEQVDSAYDDLLQREKEQNSLTSHFDTLIEPKKKDRTEQPVYNKKESYQSKIDFRKIAENIKHVGISLENYKKQFLIEINSDSVFKKRYPNFKASDLKEQRWKNLYYFSTGSHIE